MGPHGEASALTAAVMTAVLDALAVECVAALRADGLRALLLKGPVTADWLYENEFRDYLDVDLLVSKSDVARAAGTLTRLGFRNLESGRSANELPPHATTFVLEGPPLAPRFPTGSMVDLHHAFHGVDALHASFWTLAEDTAETVRVAGADIEAPGEAMRTLMLALHAAGSGRHALQPLEDLDRALERVPVKTWRSASELAVRLEVVPQLVAGLSLRPRGRELVDRLQLESSVDERTALYALGIPPVAGGIERLRATHGLRRRAQLLARELVPTPSFMRFWSPLARGGAAGLALAYVYRPLWLVVKLPRALRALAAARRVTRR